MATNKATIKRGSSKTSLLFHVGTKKHEIVLTDDNPNNIKSTFNSLLKALKEGVLQFKLDDDKDDLYHNICIEYIAQLNAELKSVFEELKHYDLLENKNE